MFLMIIGIKRNYDLCLITLLPTINDYVVRIREIWY